MGSSPPVESVPSGLLHKLTGREPRGAEPGERLHRGERLVKAHAGDGSFVPCLFDSSVAPAECLMALERLNLGE